MNITKSYQEIVEENIIIILNINIDDIRDKKCLFLYDNDLLVSLFIQQENNIRLYEIENGINTNKEIN